MCLCVDPTQLAQQAASSHISQEGWLQEPCELNHSVSRPPPHPSDSKLELGTVPFPFYLLPSHLHPTTFTLKNSSPTQAIPQSQGLLG